MLKSCFQPQLVLTENTVNYKALCWFSVRTSQRTLTPVQSVRKIRPAGAEFHADRWT
jgi:hypothetical protein